MDAVCAKVDAANKVTLQIEDQEREAEVLAVCCLHNKKDTCFCVVPDS